MTKITKAIFFGFNGEDILKAHLFEHCLGAYFLDHDLPLYKVKIHPLGVCVLFDDEVPEFPNVSDLEPYIENQKKRVNIELLAALNARDLLIERLHQLHSETFKDAVTKIEGVLNWNNQEALKDFERMYKTKVEATDVTATLPKISTKTGFEPTKHKIRIPKLDPRLDVVEITVRVPSNLEVFTWWVRMYSQAEREVEKLTILSDLAHGFFYSVNTLSGGYHYFSHSPKTRAGRGQKAIDSLIEILKSAKIEKERFEHWKKRIAKETKKKWEEGKLTDLRVTELLLWRRILKSKDFESLDYQRIADLHQELLFNPDNIYILTDF